MRRQYGKTNEYDNRPQQNIYPAAGGRVADGGGDFVIKWFEHGMAEIC